MAARNKSARGSKERFKADVPTSPSLQFRGAAGFEMNGLRGYPGLLLTSARACVQQSRHSRRTGPESLG